MKEYTIASVVSVLIIFIVDIILGTKLFSRKNFWLFWLVMAAITFLVNGYLTWRPIVMYGEQFQLGFRIWTIPIEDFIFGFSLITLNIIIWERLTRKLNA